MKVRREGVQTRSETGTRGPGTGSAVCGSACPASRMGTGTKKKCASPQQYVEGLNGETARRSRVSALAAEAS
jgi:hypothetical protein